MTASTSPSTTTGSPGDSVTPTTFPRPAQDLENDFAIGTEHEVAQDLRIGLAFVHRDLGRVIEDVSADSGNFLSTGFAGSGPFSCPPEDTTSHVLSYRLGEMLGAYASVSRRSCQITGTLGISFLVEPLVNEAVIPLPDKDAYNRGDRPPVPPDFELISAPAESGDPAATTYVDNDAVLS
jgi:hypothetical protein